MDKPISDFKDLLAAFEKFLVEYLIIGGHAFMYYAEPKYTKDFDVWVNPTPENALRVYHALTEFGAPLSGIVPADLCNPSVIYQLGLPPVRVDILNSISGVEFADCWLRRIRANILGMDGWIISLQDLIQNKLATGRPHDASEAQTLQRFAKD